MYASYISVCKHVDSSCHALPSTASVGVQHLMSEVPTTRVRWSHRSACFRSRIPGTDCWGALLWRYRLGRFDSIVSFHISILKIVGCNFLSALQFVVSCRAGAKEPFWAWPRRFISRGNSCVAIWDMNRKGVHKFSRISCSSTALVWVAVPVVLATVKCTGHVIISPMPRAVILF